MSTSLDFIEYVCEQINGVGLVRYKKMFGEYMVYVNEKPVFLVCDDTVYVKKHELLKDIMQDAELGYPYKGAKEQYILNIDDEEFSQEIVKLIEPIISIPKPKKSKIVK